MDSALLGALLVLIGTTLLVFTRRAKGGALILIGPIPILTSSGRTAAKILFVLALTFLFMMAWWFS